MKYYLLVVFEGKDPHELEGWQRAFLKRFQVEQLTPTKHIGSILPGGALLEFAE